MLQIGFGKWQPGQGHGPLNRGSCEGGRGRTGERVDRGLRERSGSAEDGGGRGGGILNLAVSIIAEGGAGVL